MTDVTFDVTSYIGRILNLFKKIELFFFVSKISDRFVKKIAANVFWDFHEDKTMAKIDLEVVKRILKRADLEGSVMNEILGELQSAVEDATSDADEPKAAPEKKQFIIVVADNDGLLKDKELVGWVVQLPEEDDMTSVSEKLLKTAKAFNLSKKGRKQPVETLGELCEYVPARIFKEQKLSLKTKTPVLVVPMANALELDELPQTSSRKDFDDDEAEVF